MKRKSYIQNRLEILDRILSNLRRLVNTSASREEYLKELDKANDLKEQIDSLIDQED